MQTNDTPRWTRVWDPVVRIGHWVLAGSFLVAYLSEDEWMRTHAWSGYVVGAVVLIRVAWGLVGTRHARFRDFVRPPRTMFGYLRGLWRGQPTHYTGHNPAGGWMIVLMLVVLAGVVHSGLMVHALENRAGPLAGWVTESYGPGHEGAMDRGGEENPDWERAEDFWEESHEVLANLMLALVFLHVVGVLVSSRLHRENLVRAMITGRKRTIGRDPS